LTGLKLGNLVRIVRLPRLYKLIRMTKFLRLLKILKEKNKLLRYITDFINVGPGFERLVVSIVSIFIFCHIACCFWYMAADF
jgi:hypothetical protein